MFSKLSKLEAKLGTIDLDDLQTLDVDSPDHVYFQMLSNFEKKYGDSYRISDWLGDVREKLVLVLLLKIESLANRLGGSNILLLTYVCDTVRICLREPLELAPVQVEHLLSSIVRILNAQASLTLSISVLRLLLNLLNRQPSRMQVFISGRIQGIQCLNGLIRFGHKNDVATVTETSDAKNNDQNIVISLTNNSNSNLSETERHEMHVKVIYHAVRIVFMISCESERLLSSLRGFRTLTVACAKRLFFCLSNHHPDPRRTVIQRDTLSSSSSESVTNVELEKESSEACNLTNFPYSETNAQLYTDLVKVLYALDNISDIASSAYFNCTNNDRAYYNANIRSNYGHQLDCDNTLETKEELSVNIYAQEWSRFLSLDETQVAAYGVADPVTGTLSSQFRKRSISENSNNAPIYSVSSKFDAKNTEEHNQDTFSDAMNGNDDTMVNIRVLDDDERAINAATLEEIRFTLVSQYLSSKNNAKNATSNGSNNANNNSNSAAQAKEDMSSTRTLVRVVQQQVAANKSETADREQSVLFLSDEKSVHIPLDKANANNVNSVNENRFTVQECEMWSAMSLVALVTEVVLTLGPCHLQPPLLFGDQQPLLVRHNNNNANNNANNNTNGNNNSINNANSSGKETYNSSSQLSGQSSKHSNNYCTYRQVYQLIVGRLSEVEEITLQLALILPETVFPSLMMCLHDTQQTNGDSRVPAVSAEAKDKDTSNFSVDDKADAKRSQPKPVSTFDDYFSIFDVIFDEDSNPNSKNNNKNNSNKSKFEVTQTRHLLHHLCRGRVAWLPDALLRVLYRVLLKTRPRTVSTNSNNNNAHLVSSVSLIPCLMLLSKLSLVLSQMTNFVKKKLTTQRWAVATQQQLDVVRFAFKHRVFPTLFEPSEHTLHPQSINNNNSTSLKKAPNTTSAVDPLAPWDCPCDTLRHEMISRMTSVSCEGNVSRLMSEILFLLCEEDKDEFKVRTGLGNSIHLMQLKGLM